MKDKKILKFKKDLARNHIRVDKLILFGSRAKNTNLKYSDYDFIIVSKDFERMPFLRRAERMEMIWKEPIHADFLCYSPEEFKRKSRQIGITRIGVREGIAV